MQLHSLRSLHQLKETMLLLCAHARPKRFDPELVPNAVLSWEALAELILQHGEQDFVSSPAVPSGQSCFHTPAAGASCL